jgi:hypothetical protein
MVARTRSHLAIGLAAVTATVAALAGCGSRAPSSAQLAPIQRAFESAAEAYQALPYPPPQPRGQPPVQASAAFRTSQLVTCRRVLAADFTPAEARRQYSVILHKVGLEARPNYVYLGGGARTLSFSSVTIDGSKATVHANVTMWARAAFLQDGKWSTIHPVNGMAVTETLVKTSSHRWLVSSFSWSFINGEGP